MAIDFAARYESSSIGKIEDLTERKEAIAALAQYYQHTSGEFAARQAAYNTITVIGAEDDVEGIHKYDKKILKAKMQGLANYHDMSLVMIDKPIIIKNPTLQSTKDLVTQIPDRMANLPNGTYLFRATSPDNNHKYEDDYCHTTTFIKDDTLSLVYDNGEEVTFIEEDMSENLLRSIFGFTKDDLKTGELFEDEEE